ncbi:MAG: peptide deformylase [Acidobacteriota bacterium]|nr:peptide deformylase [Acidobacteriota bacterium]
MAVGRILQLGDPILRGISSAVTGLDQAAITIADLRDTLHEFQRTHGFGRGISAVQIGTLERLIYLEFQGEPIALVNPEFVYLSSLKFQLWDDCFSFPDLLVYLERSETVRLNYFDEHGASRHLEASGALSELLQHEMDHLDGILAVDRAIDRNSLCTREEFDRRLKRAAAVARPMK